MKSSYVTLAGIPLLLCFMVLAGCQPTQQETVAVPTAKPDLAKVRTEIQALETEFGKATTHHDLDALLEYYADDAISLANDTPMLVGKKAIGEHYKKNVMGDGKTHTYQTIDVFVEGNIVIETGKSTTTDAAGQVGTGKYMALYEKRNGQYVCLREIYNNDKAMR